MTRLGNTNATEIAKVLENSYRAMNIAFAVEWSRFAEEAGVNQILPHKNLWAWNLYKQGKNNNWMPEEIPMTKDIQNWKHKTAISDDEKLLIKRCLGFFAGSESLVGNIYLHYLSILLIPNAGNIWLDKCMKSVFIMTRLYTYVIA